MAENASCDSSARRFKELEGRIRDRTANIGIIGLGYVGLPLAVELAQAGFAVTVYETMTPVPSESIRRGAPGRERELADWIAAIEAMGRAGIPVLCYNLGQGGKRTSSQVLLRGGAVTTEHDYAESRKLPPAAEVYTDEQLWEALTWLLERIVPVCERANVRLGYHPNDPAVSPYLGSAQIMISPAAYRRLFAIADSPCNGVTFCQGNFRSMQYAPGETIYSVATEFAERQNRVGLFRSIRPHVEQERLLVAAVDARPVHQHAVPHAVARAIELTVFDPVIIRAAGSVHHERPLVSVRLHLVHGADAGGGAAIGRDLHHIRDRHPVQKLLQTGTEMPAGMR